MDVREIEVDSPLDDVQVGTVLDYYSSNLYIVKSGNYFTGREEGKSPVKRIYAHEYFDGDERMDSIGKDAIFAELENGKLIIIGWQRIEDGVVTVTPDRNHVKF